MATTAFEFVPFSTKVLAEESDGSSGVTFGDATFRNLEASSLTCSGFVAYEIYVGCGATFREPKAQYAVDILTGAGADPLGTEPGVRLTPSYNSTGKNMSLSFEGRGVIVNEEGSSSSEIDLTQVSVTAENLHIPFENIDGEPWVKGVEDDGSFRPTITACGRVYIEDYLGDSKADLLVVNGCIKANEIVVTSSGGVSVDAKVSAQAIQAARVTAEYNDNSVLDAGGTKIISDGGAELFVPTLSVKLYTCSGLVGAPKTAQGYVVPATGYNGETWLKLVSILPD